MPSCLSFGKNFAEEGLLLLMERMIILQTKDASERYAYLVKHTDLLNRVPQKHLANPISCHLARIFSSLWIFFGYPF